MKLKFLYILLIFSNLYLNAQLSLGIQSDVGSNNLSENTFLKSALLSNYKLEKYDLSAAFQFDIISTNKNVLSGINLNVSRNTIIKNSDFKISAFYMYLPYSHIVNEFNYGLRVSKKLNHFNCNLGLGFKTISYTNNAINTYNLSGNSSVNEIFNLLYTLDYNIKPDENNWNLGVSITNTDVFLMNQGTNPILNINGHYNLKENVQLYAQIWYETAGAFNLHTNYFGMFFRPGIIWKLK